jgi:hypothetical protein
MNEEPTLRCDCGAPWVACAPGTATDATRYQAQGVMELFAAEEVPLRLWCLKCWPFRKRSAA